MASTKHALAGHFPFLAPGALADSEVWFSPCTAPEKQAPSWQHLGLIVLFISAGRGEAELRALSLGLHQTRQLGERS